MLWFIVGLIIGIAILKIVSYLNNNNIKLRWYEWIIGAVGVIMLLFTMQNYLGFLAVHEFKAAGIALMVYGIPALIALFLTWFLVKVRMKKTKGISSSGSSVAG